MSSFCPWSGDSNGGVESGPRATLPCAMMNGVVSIFVSGTRLRRLDELDEAGLISTDVVVASRFSRSARSNYIQRGLAH